MNKYKVEYLTVINAKENFCNSVSSFNNLLQSYDNVSINAGKIDFDGVSFDYDVQSGEIHENKQRFFHIELKCNDKKNLDKFKELLKSVRTILSKASEKPPEILWDDISSELANKAYPIVHEIENMMRKLITKFMLTSIGLAWIKDAVPKEVSESIKSKTNAHSQNYLYEADFIQLSNFLFKEYSTANSRQLVEKLEKATDIAELNLEELKELVPQSNWERYFSPFVDCKSDYIKTRWKKLYELRCKVAHNKFLSNGDYEDIYKLAIEVKEKLAQAIENLDKVQISEAEKEDVAENIAINMNELYGHILNGWNTVNDLLIHLFYTNGGHREDKNRANTPQNLVKYLTEERIISEDLVPLIIELNDLRNSIVHHSDLQVSRDTLYKSLESLEFVKARLTYCAEEQYKK